MSIKCMTRVWDLSQQKGANLLLLLAIADHAADDGFAWPSVETLSHKIRMSVRHTRRIIAELEAAGELYVDRSDNHNRYIVTVGQQADTLALALHERFRVPFPEAETIAQNICSGGHLVTMTSCQGDILSGEGGHMCPGHEDIAMSSEPSLTVNETSDDEVVAPGAEKAAPHGHILADVVALYEQEIGGTLTAMIFDDITDLVTHECHDLDRWRAAFQASIGARNRWKYVKAIILHPERKPPTEVTRDVPQPRSGNRRATPRRTFSVPGCDEINRLNREAEERLRKHEAATAG